MRLSKQSLTPAVRLARSYAAAAPKPDIEYEAESSTAAQKRQQSSPSRPTNNPKPRRGPRATSLLRAQKLAQALQSIPTPASSKGDIKQIGANDTPPPPPPTLADLEAKRPERPPPAITSRSYRRLYERLFNSIDRAFVSQQLLPFARKLGVKIYRGRGKEVAVRGILKIWGWEDPNEVYEPEKYSSKKGREMDWNLTKAELWLIMRDPYCLQPALDGGIKFTTPPSPLDQEMGMKVDTGMRTLKGQGNAAVLQEVNQRINDARTSMTRHTRLFVPGQSGVEKQLGVLATISNASGAYLEPIFGGGVRVSALTLEQASIATSLLEQYKSYTMAQTKIPLNLITPSSTLEMSLFPHIPSSISSIPWQSIDKLSQPLFRLRGVQQWETKVGMRGVAHKEEKLDTAGSYRISATALSAESQPLSERIAETLQTGDDITTVARFGHLLFTDSSSNASMLSPGDNSRFTPKTLKDTPITRSKPVLLPSVPPALIQYPIEGPSQTIRSLRYQSQTDIGQFCDITYTVPPFVESGSVEPEKAVAEESGWHQELNEQMARLGVEEETAETTPEEVAAEQIDTEGTSGEQVNTEGATTVEGTAEEIRTEEVVKEEAATGEVVTEEAITGEVDTEEVSTDKINSEQGSKLDLGGFEIRIGQEKAENFIMPDRPIDFTMTTSNARPIEADTIPNSVIEYLHSLAGTAPPILELQGQTWSLITAVEKVITQSDLSVPTPNIESEAQLSPVNVILRSVKSTDLTFGQDRVVRYAELETTGEILPVFWEQLANWTRAVAPGAGSLRTAIY